MFRDLSKYPEMEQFIRENKLLNADSVIVAFQILCNATETSETRWATHKQWGDYLRHEMLKAIKKLRGSNPSINWNTEVEDGRQFVRSLKGSP